MTCKLDSVKDVASCHFSESASGQSTVTESIQSGYKEAMSPVTITAGAEKLSAGAGASTTAESSQKTASPSPTDSAASQTSATAATSTTKTGAAGPSRTQNAMLVAVGAAVNVLALL